jgi:hypothetical protein
MKRVIIPPEHVDTEDPVIFLAGPITGARDWQKETITMLLSMNDRVFVASPRRPPNREEDFTGDVYIDQIAWETLYLRRAGTRGAVLFWLAREPAAGHRCDRPYAQTTRFELGEWKEYARRDGVKLALGMEEGFSSARYIRRRFADDCPQVRVCTTLEETCRHAIELACI